MREKKPQFKLFYRKKTTILQLRAANGVGFNHNLTFINTRKRTRKIFTNYNILDAVRKIDAYIDYGNIKA